MTLEIDLINKVIKGSAKAGDIKKSGLFKASVESEVKHDTNK